MIGSPLNSPLGKNVAYIEHYDPNLLFAIPRKIKREEVGLKSPLPFTGVDVWNAYELSWLNPKGKPVVACAKIEVPCSSLNLIESKSLKLYLNSFNQTKFESIDQVKKAIENDLSDCSSGDVRVEIMSADLFSGTAIADFNGLCLDSLDIETDVYEVQPEFLNTHSEKVEEMLYSNLLKSNCLVTGQPDWASVQIHYRGNKINHEGLLKYIISFRQHNEFHEQCIERIYMDLVQRCNPEKLTVYGRYTRRGGLDINPFRTNFDPHPPNIRHFRQ